MSDDIPDGLAQPRRQLAFITIAATITMAVLDGALLVVALPVIAEAFAVEAADAIWVVTVYQLATVVALLPMAAIGEIVGLRRVYLSGVAVFVVASALCAISGSLLELTAIRALQGLSASAIMSLNGAQVRYIMPARLLGRGISAQALVVGVASAAGPMVASAILSVGSWHWLFLINVPIGLIAFGVGLGTLPKSIRSGRRLDFVSVFLNALTFGLLIYALGNASHFSTWPVNFGLLLLAGIAGCFLARRQLGRASPMLPIDLLRIRPFAKSVGASLCSFTAQFLALVTLPFYLFGALGYSAVETGLLLTPWPIAAAATAPVAGRLVERVSPHWLGLVGMVLFSAGLLAIAFLPEQPHSLDILWRVAICGIGFGLFHSPNNLVMISSAPRERSGGASGMQSTARLVGQSFGAALAASIANATGYTSPLVPMSMAAAFALAAGGLSLWRQGR